MQKTSRLRLKGGTKIDEYEKIMNEYYDNISDVNNILYFDLIAVFYMEKHILYNLETTFDFINAIKKEESNDRIGRHQTVRGRSETVSSRRKSIRSRSRSRYRSIKKKHTFNTRKNIYR